MRGQNFAHQSALIFHIKTYGLYLFGALMLCVLCSCSKKEHSSVVKEAPLSDEVLIMSDFKPQLNDTGIISGGDYPQGINDDCSAKINQQMFCLFHFFLQMS